MNQATLEKVASRGPGRPVEKEHNKHFLEIWNSAKSRGTAAGKLGMSKLAASARATYLRHRGYKIKAFPQGRPPKS